MLVPFRRRHRLVARTPVHGGGQPHIKGGGFNGWCQVAHPTNYRGVVDDCVEVEEEPAYEAGGFD